MAPRTAALVDEVVQVYRDGDALSIVIRDLALAEAEAVACAFETARRLAGDAGSLRQVTLNGRRIFQAPAPSDPLPGRPAVSFTC